MLQLMEGSGLFLARRFAKCWCIKHEGALLNPKEIYSALCFILHVCSWLLPAASKLARRHSAQSAVWGCCCGTVVSGQVHGTLWPGEGHQAMAVSRWFGLLPKKHAL